MKFVYKHSEKLGRVVRQSDRAIPTEYPIKGIMPSIKGQRFNMYNLGWTM
jgi:hypothetical protein